MTCEGNRASIVREVRRMPLKHSVWNREEEEVLPVITIAHQVIPLVRRISRIHEKGDHTYIIRLPRDMNELWQKLYKARRSIIIYLKVK